MTFKPLAMALAIAAASCVTAMADEPGWFAAPEMQKAPDLTLGLGDPAWATALKIPINKLDDASGRISSEYMVESYWLRSGSSLFIGFKCMNPDSPAKFATPGEPRDGAVYSRECVEMFIGDFNGDLFFQIVVDYAGNIFDGKRFDSKWDGPVKVAVKPFKGYWTLVMEIPEPVLSQIWKPGSFITANAIRHGFKANGSGEVSVSMSPPGAHNPKERIALGSLNLAIFASQLEDGIASFKASFANVEIPKSIQGRLAAVAALAKECRQPGDMPTDKFHSYHSRYISAKAELASMEKDIAMEFTFNEKD